jgi:N6-adenosine-specific RNA methylase IME4
MRCFRARREHDMAPTANAHLHLWVTTPLLADGLAVIRAWGFRYKSCFVWAKDKRGMGNYWRVSHEILLLGGAANSGFVTMAPCASEDEDSYPMGKKWLHNRLRFRGCARCPSQIQALTRST